MENLKAIAKKYLGFKGIQTSIFAHIWYTIINRANQKIVKAEELFREVCKERLGSIGHLLNLSS
jgi:hypothetical protein